MCELIRLQQVMSLFSTMYCIAVTYCFSYMSSPLDKESPHVEVRVLPWTIISNACAHAREQLECSMNGTRNVGYSDALSAGQPWQHSRKRGTARGGTPDGQHNCRDLRSAAGTAGRMKGAPRPPPTGRALRTGRSGAARLRTHPAGSSHPAGLARSLCWLKRPPTRIGSSYLPPGR